MDKTKEHKSADAVATTSNTDSGKDETNLEDVEKEVLAKPDSEADTEGDKISKSKRLREKKKKISEKQNDQMKLLEETNKNLKEKNIQLEKIVENIIEETREKRMEMQESEFFLAMTAEIKLTKSKLEESNKRVTELEKQLKNAKEQLNTKDELIARVERIAIEKITRVENRVDDKEAELTSLRRELENKDILETNRIVELINSLNEELGKKEKLRNTQNDLNTGKSSIPFNNEMKKILNVALNRNNKEQLENLKKCHELIQKILKLGQREENKAIFEQELTFFENSKQVTKQIDNETLRKLEQSIVEEEIELKERISEDNRASDTILYY